MSDQPHVPAELVRRRRAEKAAAKPKATAKPKAKAVAKSVAKAAKTTQPVERVDPSAIRKMLDDLKLSRKDAAFAIGVTTSRVSEVTTDATGPRARRHANLATWTEKWAPALAAYAEQRKPAE